MYPWPGNYVKIAIICSGKALAATLQASYILLHIGHAALTHTIATCVRPYVGTNAAILISRKVVS